MKTKLCKKLVSLTLAFALMIGMMPAIPGAVSIAHASTTITEVSVTDITAPKVGQTPAYTASVAADAAYYIETGDINDLHYDKNGITWVKLVNGLATEVAQDAPFIAGDTYEVRMEINADDGYTFDTRTNLNSNSNVKINGQPASVISWLNQGKKVYIKHTFPALEEPETITSIKFSHDTDIKDRQTVGKVKVSEINGTPYEGPEVIANANWYRSTANFTNINESGVNPWNGTAFDGGYAYGLRIELPDLDGYVYPQSFAVSLKTPSAVYYPEQLDANGVCYFFWNKLAHIPQLNSVNITMDGFYVDENIMDLTFTSEEAIKTDGGYGLNKRYTIKQYNAGTGDYDTLSNTVFVANKKYYLFYYLESDLNLQGLDKSNVKLNGIAAISKGIESSGKTYYIFSLDELTEQDILKTTVSSIVVSLPKAPPIVGDDLYVPTIVSVNGDANLASAIKKVDATWYQNDFHIPEQGDYGQAESKFVQGKSYCLYMTLFLAGAYELADDYAVIVQTPSGVLEGELDSYGESYVTYEYYFNLGAPTELPMLTSYTVELSGYQAGAKIEDTALTMIMNGLSLPKEMLAYGMGYTIANENQEPILKGPFDYDTQYYLGTIVAPYNCKIDGLTETQVKNIASLNGIHPETAIAMEMGGKLLGWQVYFKLPVLKQGTSCNGLEHDYVSDMVPATFDTDGKTYKKCKGCGAEGDVQAIAKVSTIQLSQTEYTYDGQNKQPGVVVKDAAGKTLIQDKDYSLVYPTESKAAGTYTVKVILKGNYSGAKDLTYKINGASSPSPQPTPTPGAGGSGGGSVTPTPTPGTPGSGTPDPHQHSYVKTVTKATAKKDGQIVEKCACGDVKSSVVIKKASGIKLSKAAYVYTGKVIKAKNLPKVIVKDSAGKTIAAKYYTVTKPKNVKKMKAIGRYAYKITFKKTCKEYTGFKTVYLQITPKKTSITKVQPVKKAVTVKWKKGKKAQVTGYQVMLATNKKFTKNAKTVTIKGYSKASKKVTKLKAKTKYFVKVRTYKTVKGVNIYSDWSKAKNVKTK